jgi:IS5 family transposase
VGKRALIAHQRYAHAKQFKRANRALKTLRTYLGRVIRDILRKIRGDAELESLFAHPLMLARRVREQRQHQRGRKVYSLHAPEVECIGKGRAHRPYEFGVKVSLATTLNRSKGGQFIAHAKALPGNNLKRIVADRGYRGHRARSQVQSLHGRRVNVVPSAFAAVLLKRWRFRRPSILRGSNGIGLDGTAAA